MIEKWREKTITTHFSRRWRQRYEWYKTANKRILIFECPLCKTGQTMVAHTQTWAHAYCIIIVHWYSLLWLGTSPSTAQRRTTYMFLTHSPHLRSANSNQYTCYSLPLSRSLPCLRCGRVKDYKSTNDILLLLSFSSSSSSMRLLLYLLKLTHKFKEGAKRQDKSTATTTHTAHTHTHTNI